MLRLGPLFNEAAKLGVPVMFHMPIRCVLFFIDRFNERYEELAAIPTGASTDRNYSKTSC